MRAALSLLCLALPFVLADHQPNVNHRELAKRAKGDLLKRGDARWTFYSTGLGACGGYNSDSDFIVALNQDTFGYSYPSKYCNKKITMTYGGKTATATIVDSCPGCPSPSGLDLSPGLFSYFGSQDLGVIMGTWWYDDGSSEPADPTTSTTTKHTTTKYTPTSTYTPPTTTYTPPTTTKKTSTSTTTSKTSSKVSSSAVPSTTSSASHAAASSISIAASSGTVSATSAADPENLYTFAQVMLDLTGVVVAGAQADN
ncbi:hypothetical protein B0H10DRAFT_2009786 [Mycena sp. CBHHK59/15]|nr:hypothetical protein B0H10DRAFT_2009786 [Mycena sp. CBHHK59/15]